MKVARFVILPAVTVKIIVFLDVKPRTLVDPYRRFGKSFASIFIPLFYPEYGGSKSLQNIDKLLKTNFFKNT
jgi:hypothetical protein